MWLGLLTVWRLDFERQRPDRVREHPGEPDGSCRDLSSPGRPAGPPWQHVLQGDGTGDGKAVDTGKAATGLAGDDGGLGRVEGGCEVHFEIKM